MDDFRMNPLVQTVQAMSAAVKAAQPTFKAPYHNPRLVELASLMLSRGKGRIRLKQEPQQRRQTANSVVLLYSGGIFSYMALLRELRINDHVHLLKIGGSPEDELVWSIEAAWESEPTDDPISWDLHHIKAEVADKRAPDLEATATIPELGEGPPALMPLMRLAVASEVASEVGAGAIVVGDYLANDLRLYRESAAVFNEFYGRPIAVKAPYQEQRPLLAIKAHLDAGFSKEAIVDLTVSCDAQRHEMHPGCGECWGCYRRFKLFEGMGWVETKFATNPWGAKQFSRFEERWAKLNA